MLQYRRTLRTSCDEISQSQKDKHCAIPLMRYLAQAKHTERRRVYGGFQETWEQRMGVIKGCRVCFSR